MWQTGVLCLAFYGNQVNIFTDHSTINLLKWPQFNEYNKPSLNAPYCVPVGRCWERCRTQMPVLRWPTTCGMVSCTRTVSRATMWCAGCYAGASFVAVPMAWRSLSHYWSSGIYRRWTCLTVLPAPHSASRMMRNYTDLWVLHWL